MLKNLCIKEADLSIAFVTNQKMIALNRKFLNRNHSTDVLAFDFTTKKLSYKKNIKAKKISGDIIISTDTAIKNSKEFKTSLGKEMILYLIHGILHLIGYNDHDKKDADKMHMKEGEILSFLGEKVDFITGL